MTPREFSPENHGAREPGIADLEEAPHSWDAAGRNVPAAKLDWTERLLFPQVRGVEVALDPDRQDPDRILPGSGVPGDDLE